MAQMPRKRPASKKAGATPASVVIVKTEINRKFKTPEGSPSLRSVPTLMMGRHGMHQFVDKKRLRYKNQMWRYRTNAVANRKRSPEGNWVSRSATTTPSGASHFSIQTNQDRSASAPPTESIPQSHNQDENSHEDKPVSACEGITTACSSYTIQYATIPVNVNADPRTEDAGQVHKPTPPAESKHSRSIEQTKTVRRMYRRKFGNQKHRLSHVDQLSSKKKVNTLEQPKPGGISAKVVSGSDAHTAAYNNYYSFLQAQVSSIS